MTNKEIDWNVIELTPAILSSVESANRVVGKMPAQNPARNTTEATSSMDTMAFVLAEIISPMANTTKMTAAEIIAVMIFFSFFLLVLRGGRNKLKSGSA